MGALAAHRALLTRPLQSSHRPGQVRAAPEETPKNECWAVSLMKLCSRQNSPVAAQAGPDLGCCLVCGRRGVFCVSIGEVVTQLLSVVLFYYM